MRFLVVALGMCAAYPFPEPKADDTPQAREISLKELKIDTAKGQKPKVDKITSEKELNKLIADPTSRDKINEQVDFSKEYLILVRWSGSGGDSLLMDVKKGTQAKHVVFQMKRGLTRDLRPHVRAYAIPKHLDYKLGL